MGKGVLHIKNMVCPRCIETVQDIFDDLGIEVSSIKLGEVDTLTNITEDQKENLKHKLEAKGFELLENQRSKLISQVKAVVIDQVHHGKEPLKSNFSVFIADKLNQEYSSLSKLFSSVEGITIERFIVKQKIEKVKELLFYDELTLSEIAFQMDYSSTAHLSAQFKKETGMTPSTFKQMKSPGHQPLDTV